MLLKNKKQKANYFGRLTVLPLAGCISLAFAMKDNSLPEIKNPPAANTTDLIIYTDTLPHNVPPAATLPSNILYVVDDEIVDGFEFGKISPDNISALKVLKGTDAIAKYGAKGKEGVIEIITKKSGDFQKAAPSNDGSQKDTANTKTKTDNTSGDDKIFKEVEKAAEFPGGRDAWRKYINGKMKENMGQFTEQDYGTCKVKFIVSKDGTISDVKATNMAGTRLAEVAIDAIKKGPKWIPAEQNGRTVASYKVQPVTVMKPDNAWPAPPPNIRSKPAL